MKKLMLVMLVALQGCTVYGGMAMHSTGADAPEVALKNPIGIIGAEVRATERIDLFIEHHSGITDYEDGVGYNLVGAKAKFKLF